MANYGRDPAKEISLPVRIPLLGLLNQREDNPRRGSRLVNGYVEKGEDGQIYVVKRPGLRVQYSMQGYGKGMDGTNSLFAEATTGGHEIKAYSNDNFVIGFGETAGPPEDAGFWWFTVVPEGPDSNIYMLHNRQQLWVYKNGELVLVPFEGASFTLLCDTTDTLTTVSTADTSGLTEFTTVSGAGITAGTFIESIDGSTTFTMSAPATATASSIVLTFASGGPAADPGPSPPGSDLSEDLLNVLTGGIVDLNTAVYLFDRRSVISASDPYGPQVWNPLARITAYARQDRPMHIASQLSYIIAFKSTSTEFFRDVGNSPGSPLERVEGLQLDVGCFASRTVCELDGTLFWVSNTASGRRSIWKMKDARPQEVAIPAVRRVLDGSTPIWAISFIVSGHRFYLVTDPEAGYTLVYDDTADYWCYWNALGETYFPFVAASINSDPESSHDAPLLLQHESDGKLYRLDPSIYDEEGEPFDMDIYLPEFDAGMRQIKYVTSMFVVADQVRYSYLKVRVSDENQTHGTWSNYRIFNLWEANPHLEQCGSFYKRSFHFNHAEKTACRLQAVELEVLPGTL